MTKWYLRDRGQVLGPFTREEILEMRDHGTVASYHEVSADNRQWKVIGDVPALGAAPKPVKPKPQPVEDESDFDEEYEPPPARGAEATGAFGGHKLVIGAVLALVLFGGAVVIGILALRSGKPKETVGAPSSSGGTGADGGAIVFTASTATRERDRILDESVGLVVVGLLIRAKDGVRTEVPEFGTGSGFVVSPSGHVITNRHVIDGLADFRNSQKRRDLERELSATLEPKVWIFFGRDNKFEADENMYISPDYDLAILKIDRSSSRYFALSKTSDLDTPRFDPVFSLGFPGTDRRALDTLNPKDKRDTTRGAPIQRNFRDADFEHTKERGAIRKNVFSARPDTKFRDTYYIPHNARISGGNSGGPLVTSDGTVVGINTLGITRKVGGVTLDQEGQNFAQTLPQLRTEIDKQVPGVVWRDPADVANR